MKYTKKGIEKLILAPPRCGERLTETWWLKQWFWWIFIVSHRRWTLHHGVVYGYCSVVEKEGFCGEKVTTMWFGADCWLINYTIVRQEVCHKLVSRQIKTSFIPHSHNEHPQNLWYMIVVIITSYILFSLVFLSFLLFLHCIFFFFFILDHI